MNWSAKKRTIDSDDGDVDDEDSSNPSADSGSEESPISDGDENVPYNKNLQREIKRLSDMMRLETSVLKPKITIQREKVSKECELLLNLPERRQEALNTLWMYCWYLPIKAIIGKPKLTKEHQAWLKSFIGCGVGQFGILAEKYTDIRSLAFIFIGDLYRYSYVNCAKTDVDFKQARQSYLKAFRQSPGYGRPLNQIALLWQEVGEVWRSLGCFLKSLVADEPFQRAVDNIKRLNETDFEEAVDGVGRRVVLSLVRSSLKKFSRLNVEKYRKEFEEDLEDMLEKKNWRSALENIHYISNITIHLSKADGNDEQIRFLGALLCKCWADVLDFVIKIKASEESVDQHFIWAILCGVGEFLAIVSQKFVTKKITVSVKFQYQNVAQLFVELLNANIGEILGPYIELKSENEFDKIKSDWLLYAPYCRNLKVLALFLKISTDNASIPLCCDGEMFQANTSCALQLQMPTDDEQKLPEDEQKLPEDEQKLPEDEQKMPEDGQKMSEDECARTTTTASLANDATMAGENCDAVASATSAAAVGEDGSATLNEENDEKLRKKEEFLEKISKVHSEYVQKEEKKQSQISTIPVYLFPDESVLMEKLSVLQHLATDRSEHHCFTVIIAEAVLFRLDRLKRESQPAREAIRWLQSALTNAHAKARVKMPRSNMVAMPDGYGTTMLRGVNEAALQHLRENGLLHRKSLFATILTARKLEKKKDDWMDDELAKYTSLSVENVDSFFLRIVEHEDCVGFT